MEEASFSTRLILSDGSVLENCDCGYYNKTLGCFLRGMQFSDVFQYFSSPEKYKDVTFDMEEEYFITRIKYSGFSRIVSMVQEEDKVVVNIEGDDITIERTKIPKEYPDSLGQ